jgi:hypothetical protein
MIFLKCLIVFIGLVSNGVASTDLPVAEIIKLNGKVSFNGKDVILGDKISDRGSIETSNKSFVLLKIDKWKNTISIGANTKMKLDFSDDKKYTIEDGICRWKSIGKSEAKGKIYSTQASFGVRGTDFIIIENKLLKETEIVMFDGSVVFENLSDNNNKFELLSGQWGGIGGRFGEKIRPPLNLEQNVLNIFKEKLE